MKSVKTLNQQRAEHAWNRIASVKQCGEKTSSEFAKQAKKLPVRIITSGLGPALAFLQAKQDSPELVAAIDDWIAARPWAFKASGDLAGASDLMSQIVHGDSSFLRLATDEVMAYLQWIIRFAEAKLTDNDKSKQDND